MMHVFPISYMSYGHRIRGLGYGPHSGVPSPVRIILLHGYSSSKHAVDPVAQALAMAGYSVTAIDLPGHKLGATGGSLQSFQVAVYAALDAVNQIPSNQPSVLIGHSMGAAVAVVAASQSHECVGSVAMGLGYPVTATRNDPRVISYYLDRWAWVDGASPLEVGLEMDRALPEALKQLTGKPFLLVSGEQDIELPPSSARTLFEMAGQPKSTHQIDADHSQIPRIAGPLIVSWVQRHWPCDV